MPKIVWGVAVAAAVLGLFAWLRAADPRSVAHPAPANAAAKSSARATHSPDVVLAIAPTASGPAAKEAMRRLSPLMADFSKRRDYKALHDRLKGLASPSAEELYVMAAILERCATVTDRPGHRGADWRLGAPDSLDRFVAALPAKAANREKRIAAFERLNHDPCAGLEGLTATSAEIKALLERAAAAGDAKARTMLLMHSFEDRMRALKPGALLDVSDADIEAIRGVMQSDDPNAIVDLVATLGFTFDNFSLRAGPEQEPIDFPALMFASHLAACDLGYPCGPDAPALMQACAFSGQCDAASYRDFLFYYHSSPATSQLAMEYHRNLMRVIRDGDWSYFTFHRGPGPAFAGLQRR